MALGVAMVTLAGADVAVPLPQVGALPDPHSLTQMGGDAGEPAALPTARHRSMAKVSGATGMPAVAPCYMGYRQALGSHHAMGEMPALWPAAVTSSPSLRVT